MIPILYSPTETEFSTNGIGMLTNAILCNVTEERNGSYELIMQYPISGIHYSDIGLRSLILAKPNKQKEGQPFRVYRITKPINGIVIIYAEHISYDLSGIPIQPFTSSSAADALYKLRVNAVVSCPFTFTTDKSTVANMTVDAPCSIRSQLGGKQGSILDVYGGEYEFDRYNVKLWNNRGSNHGVSIRYGKNLTDLKQEQNCANVYTGVYPFWKNSTSGEVVQLDTPIINVSGTFDFVRILTLDLSSEWQETPTQAQLRSKAQSYITNNKIGVPSVSLTLSFVQLEGSEEYKGKALLERIALCDTVNVVFDKLGVNTTAKAIKVVYNVLLDRVDSVELGDSRTNLTDTIITTEQTVNRTPSIISDLTQNILGAHGGAVRFIDEDGDGKPDTLYIADHEDPEQATKVWRFNYEGWGASNNGYEGPFIMGASLDNGIVADFIKAGTLNANLISAGRITDKTGNNYWDMETGELRITSSTYIDNLQTTLGDKFNNLESRIDGEITTWFYDYTPTLVNAPASSWTTDTIKNNHLGDLFYDKTAGYAYRFVLDGNVYKWVQISDTAITTALVTAAEAQDTADSKRRVFTLQPTTPYDVGDLWFYRNEILICNKSRTENESYVAGDWSKNDGYTGDGEAAYAKNYLYESYKELTFVDGQLDSGNNVYELDSDGLFAVYKTLVTGPAGLIPRSPDSGNTNYVKTFCISFDVNTEGTGPSTRWEGEDVIAVKYKLRFYGKFFVPDEEDPLMPSGETYDEYRYMQWEEYFPYSPNTYTRIESVLNIGYGLHYDFLELYSFTDFTIEMHSSYYGHTVNIRNVKLEVGLKCTPWCANFMDDAYMYRQMYNRLDSVDVQYALGDSSDEAPETGWSTSSPVWTEGKFIWTRTQTISGGGVITYSAPVCIQGAQGVAGIGITDIEEQYYLSTSNEDQIGGSWSTAQPVWENNKYIWTRSKITWSDEEESYTEPVLAKAINGANEVADVKKRVFITQPVPPYNIGDMWCEGSSGDILTCTVARKTGSFSAGDWSKLNKYTDDTAVNALNVSLNQQEIFNRLTNNGTVEGIYLENGHLYINASYIATGTITDVNEKNSWDLDNGVLRISGSTLVGEDGTETTIGGMATRISSVEQSVTPEGIVSVVRSAPLYYQDLNKERNYVLNSDKYLLYNAGKLYVESVEQSSLRYEYDLSSNLFADSNNANLVLRVSFDMKRTNVPANTDYLEVQIVYRNSSGQGYNRSSKVKSEEIITDNDWTHTRYGRFDFSEDDVASFVCMRIVFTAELQCQIEIKNVKIEVSDTYTAWCPAIEDNTGFYNRISSAEQRISDTGIVTIVQSQGGIFRDGTSGKLVSMIGQTAEEITIDAEQIQIGGYTYGNADVQGGVPGALYTGGQLQASGVSTSTGLSATNTDWAFWAGSGKYRVSQSGALVAKNATLEGTLITTHWALLSAGLGYFTDASSPSNSKFSIGYSASGNTGTVGDGHHSSDCVLAGRYIEFSTTGGSLQITKVDGMSDLCFVPAGISANIGAKTIPFDALYGKHFVTISSRKVKHDILSLGNVGNIIDQLTPVSFKYNGTEKKSFGLILEDTIEILPEICDAPSENDTSGGGGIKYTELIPILLAEVKALRQRIAQLEKIAEVTNE